MKSGEREETNMLKHHRQQTGRFIRITVVLVVLLVASFGSWSCSKGDYSGKMESITIGTIPWEPSALS
jgi:hypothetical protein